MKKLIAGLMAALMTLLTVVSPVLAFGATAPCPIALIVKTLPADSAVGLTVVLSYNGVPIKQARVNQYKEVMFEVSQIPGVQCGSFDAKILECEEKSACHKTVGFNPAGFTVWDISGVDVPCPVCSDCPTTTTTTLSEDYCIDEGFILPEDCPSGFCMELFQFVVTIIVALGGGAGVSLVISKKKDGGISVRATRHKHNHVSTSGRRYHSIYTVHRSEPHPKGEINPKYSEAGKYLG